MYFVVYRVVSVMISGGESGYRVWEALNHGGLRCDFDDTALRNSRTNLLRFVISVRHEREHIRRAIEIMGGVARGLIKTSSPIG